MDKTLRGLEEPIVAIVCEDREKEFHFLFCESFTTLKDLDFQEDVLLIGNLAVYYNWFDSVAFCTKQTLDEIMKELQNA